MYKYDNVKTISNPHEVDLQFDYNLKVISLHNHCKYHLDDFLNLITKNGCIIGINVSDSVICNIEEVTQAIQSNPIISVLVLKGIRAGVAEYEAVSRCLAATFGIHTFDFSRNPLPQGAVATFAHALSCNRTIKTLTLNGIGLTGALSAVFFAAPLSCALTRLDLRCNALGTQGAGHLATTLAGHSALRELVVSRNGLGLEGATVLMAAVATTQLKLLDLEDNQIGDNIAPFAAILPHCSSLTSLNLATNRISDGGVAVLCEAVRQNPSLSSLFLSCNPISRRGMETIASTIQKCHWWTEICSPRDKDVFSFPVEIQSILTENACRLWKQRSTCTSSLFPPKIKNECIPPPPQGSKTVLYARDSLAFLAAQKLAQSNVFLTKASTHTTIPNHLYYQLLLPLYFQHHTPLRAFRHAVCVGDTASVQEILAHFHLHLLAPPLPLPPPPPSLPSSSSLSPNTHTHSSTSPTHSSFSSGQAFHPSSQENVECNGFGVYLPEPNSVNIKALRHPQSGDSTLFFPVATLPPTLPQLSPTSSHPSPPSSPNHPPPFSSPNHPSPSSSLQNDGAQPHSKTRTSSFSGLNARSTESTIPLCPCHSFSSSSANAKITDRSAAFPSDARLPRFSSSSSSSSSTRFFSSLFSPHSPRETLIASDAFPRSGAEAHVLTQPPSDHSAVLLSSGLTSEQERVYLAMLLNSRTFAPTAAAPCSSATTALAVPYSSLPLHLRSQQQQQQKQQRCNGEMGEKGRNVREKKWTADERSRLDGLTPLHIACLQQDGPMLAALLRIPAPLCMHTAESPQGITPQVLCAELGGERGGGEGWGWGQDDCHGGHTRE